ncbi:hypothetical protein GN330_03550 [Nitratireductor sp. CAU 1489]|uniref:Lipoprotein n=1 Tax=Nitratireductor arenosus TaxID=2682096 RepID=A0A844QE74_9HYPH|nr:hypothetical protein [Nitratireductor arenosus]MVA96320.1 hypothetical protein [Nitratireductor arenosus]
MRKLGKLFPVVLLAILASGCAQRVTYYLSQDAYYKFDVKYEDDGFAADSDQFVYRLDDKGMWQRISQNYDNPELLQTVATARTRITPAAAETEAKRRRCGAVSRCDDAPDDSREGGTL